MKFASNHQLFAGIDFGAAREVEVHLGANPACARHLVGWGVPCVLYPRNPDGTTQGTGAHPGYVVELEFGDLESAGFRNRELWLALGAELGRYVDPNEDGAPVCMACAREGDSYSRFEDDDPSDWRTDDDGKYIGAYHMLLPADEIGPCWSCCQMIAESIDASREQLLSE